MKSLLLISCTLLIGTLISAQDIKHQVISSAGGFNKSFDNSVSLSWTLGEFVMSTIHSADNQISVTQGFQNYELMVTGINENPDLGVSIKVYPNPTTEIVNIKLESPLKGETTINITGPDGKMVWNSGLLSGELMKQISIQDYPSGTFILSIQNGTKRNTYKIMKL